MLSVFYRLVHPFLPDHLLTEQCCSYETARLGPMQAIVGDQHGLNTRDHQPAKLAAMEALWETTEGAPLTLFAITDKEARENRMEVSIPKLGSLIVTHDPNGKILGLNEFEGLHPPVAPVFWSFRVMVGLGLLMIAVASLGTYYLFPKGQLPKWFLKVLLGMTFYGWVATLSGWYVTEIGRQRWLVYGVLKTKDAVADLPPSHVGLTLSAYLITYFILGVAYIYSLYYLARKAMTEEPKQQLPA